MDASIAVALISCFGVSLGAILTFVVQIKKLRQESEENAQRQTDELNKSIQANINNNRNEYLDGIAEVKKSVSELNLCMVDLKASWQNQMALNDLRMEHLAKEFADMKIEVREHNNFAKRLPILEEKMSVANHRIADLEGTHEAHNG